MLRSYYKEEDYGFVFVLSDKEVKKLIGIVKTTKRDNTIEKRVNHILLSKKPSAIYKRIVENKSPQELENINNMEDDEKLNKLNEELCIVDFIYARNVFLDKLKSFLTKIFLRYFFEVIMGRYGISKDSSSNSNELDEDLFPNTISTIPEEYRTSISPKNSIITKKDLRKCTVEAFREIGTGTINDIRNKMKEKWIISRNLKTDTKVLCQYLSGEYKDTKREKRTNNTIYIAK